MMTFHQAEIQGAVFSDLSARLGPCPLCTLLLKEADGVYAAAVYHGPSVGSHISFEYAFNHDCGSFMHTLSPL